MKIPYSTARRIIIAKEPSKKSVTALGMKIPNGEVSRTLALVRQRTNREAHRNVPLLRHPYNASNSYRAYDRITASERYGSPRRGQRWPQLLVSFLITKMQMEILTRSVPIALRRFPPSTSKMTSTHPRSITFAPRRYSVHCGAATCSSKGKNPE
jgi:hypothetical protein